MEVTTQRAPPPSNPRRILDFRPGTGRRWIGGTSTSPSRWVTTSKPSPMPGRASRPKFPPVLFLYHQSPSALDLAAAKTRKLQRGKHHKAQHLRRRSIQAPDQKTRPGQRRKPPSCAGRRRSGTGSRRIGPETDSARDHQIQRPHHAASTNPNRRRAAHVAARIHVQRRRTPQKSGASSRTAVPRQLIHAKGKGAPPLPLPARLPPAALLAAARMKEMRGSTSADG